MDTSKYTVCGVIILEDLIKPVYFVPNEGSFIFEDPMDNEYHYLGGVGARAVFEHQKVEETGREIMEGKYGETTIGLLFCKTYVIVIDKNGTVDNRGFGSITEPTGNAYEYDLDMMFEED